MTLIKSIAQVKVSKYLFMMSNLYNQHTCTRVYRSG